MICNVDDLYIAMVVTCNMILMVRMISGMIKQMLRPDSKRALIFSAIRADSGDCGSNLKIFKILP